MHDIYSTPETAPYKSKETEMSEGINTDKVIVNAGGGGEGAGNMAAVIAALGNRNQGDNTAALIAALGNRNDDSNSMAPLLAMLAGDRNRMPYGDGLGGFGGMNGILGIAALGLIFGRGRGGLFGGDGDGGGGCGAETRLQSNADTLAILQQIGQAKDATTGGFATTALALSQGFANVRDSIQASTFLLNKELCDVNQNVSSQGCQTREAVQNDGDKTRALLIARFQQQDATTIAEQNARIVALETRGHADRNHAEQRLEINNTNTAVAAQAQQQQQQQRQADLDLRFHRLESIIGNVLQVAHATNQNIIAGNSGAVATGAQTANPTNVNARG